MALCARSPQVRVGLNLGLGCGWSGTGHFLQSSQAGTRGGGGGGGGGDAAPPARAWPPLMLLPPASPSRERTQLPTSPLSLELPRHPRPHNKTAVKLNLGKLEDDSGSGEQEKDDQIGTTRVKINSGELEDDTGSGVQEKDDQIGTRRVKLNSRNLEHDADSGKHKEADHHLKELLRQIVGPKEQLVDLVGESPDNSIIQEKLKELLDLVRESPDNSIIQEKMKVKLNSGELEDDTGSGVQEKDDQIGTRRVKLNSRNLEHDADLGKHKEADHHLKELLRQIVGPKEQLADLVGESPDNSIIQEKLKELLDLVRESPDNSIIQEKMKVSSCSAGASGSGRCSGSRNTRKNSEPREGATLKARSARLPSRDEEVEDGEEDPYPPPFLKCALCGRSSATFYHMCCATPVCNSCCCTCEEKAQRKLPKVKLDGADLFLWSKTEYEALPRNPLMLVSARRVKYKLQYSFAPVHEVVDENSVFLHLTIYSFYLRQRPRHPGPVEGL